MLPSNCCLVESKHKANFVVWLLVHGWLAPSVQLSNTKLKFGLSMLTNRVNFSSPASNDGFDSHDEFDSQNEFQLRTLPTFGTMYFLGGGALCSAAWRFLGLTSGLLCGDAIGDLAGERTGDFSPNSIA